MGTNYYYYKEPICKKCLREHGRMHIGKSSGGWCFGLHIYPPDVNNLNDWIDLFNISDSYIRNEYGEVITKEEMIDIITERKWDNRARLTTEFLKQNSATIGPNNLLRRKILPNHCIGHGEGTWDYLIGEFS